MKIKHFFNGRYFKVLFDKKYKKEKLKLRRGECKECGDCCRTCIFGFRCPFLHKNKCLIHKIKPRFCREGPVDEIALKENNSKTCGLYFIKQKHI